MTEREKEWADYQAWKKDFTGPIYFQNWDQWIAEFGFASWQASRRAALEEAAQLCDKRGLKLTVAQYVRRESQNYAASIRALATGDKHE